MSRGTLVVILALAVLAVAWGFGQLGAPEEAGLPRAATRRAARARGAAGVLSTPDDAPRPSTWAARADEPLRDLFVYGDGGASPGTPAPAGTAPPSLPPPAAVATPTPSPLRLVGFVQRGAQLSAAVSAWGEVVVAGAGERVGDFRVLAVDADRGVRLRAPDGRELLLRPE